MDHNGRNHRSNASTGNKNHINLLRYTAPAILCLKHKPIVLNSLAGHRKTFAWVVCYIPFKSQFQLNRNNWKYIVSFWCILFTKSCPFSEQRYDYWKKLYAWNSYQIKTFIKLLLHNDKVLMILHLKQCW